MQCKTRKGQILIPEGLTNTSGATLFHIGIDLIGPLPETSAGHKYVLTISDYCTKWVAAIALESKHASGVAIALFKVKSNNNKCLTMFESLLPNAKNLMHCRCSCKWVYLEF